MMKMPRRNPKWVASVLALCSGLFIAFGVTGFPRIVTIGGVCLAIIGFAGAMIFPEHPEKK